MYFCVAEDVSPHCKIFEVTGTRPVTTTQLALISSNATLNNIEQLVIIVLQVLNKTRLAGNLSHEKRGA